MKLFRLIFLSLLSTAVQAWMLCFLHEIYSQLNSIDLFRIRRATSVPLGKGTKFALCQGKMSTTKRRAIQILHISTFQFTLNEDYKDFISKYTDINSLHVTQIN